MKNDALYYESITDITTSKNIYGRRHVVFQLKSTSKLSSSIRFKRGQDKINKKDINQDKVGTFYITLSLLMKDTFLSTYLVRITIVLTGLLLVLVARHGSCSAALTGTNVRDLCCQRQDKG